MRNETQPRSPQRQSDRLLGRHRHPFRPGQFIDHTAKPSACFDQYSRDMLLCDGFELRSIAGAQVFDCRQELNGLFVASFLCVELDEKF